MPDRITVLVVADDAADCGGLLSTLSDTSIFDVVGPLTALEALRFCSRSVPSIVLVHAGLRDILAAEFCLLLRGRAKDRAYSALLFGATKKGTPVASPSELAPADEYISQAELPALAARLTTLAAQHAIDDQPPVREYRGRHLAARFDRVDIVVDCVRRRLTGRCSRRATRGASS
jgi:PleD family two-component response regulator